MAIETLYWSGRDMVTYQQISRRCWVGIFSGIVLLGIIGFFTWGAVTLEWDVLTGFFLVAGVVTLGVILMNINTLRRVRKAMK